MLNGQRNESKQNKKKGTEPVSSSDFKSQVGRGRNYIVISLLIIRMHSSTPLTFFVAKNKKKT